MRNTDPRTFENIVANRPWLTPAGCAATGGHLWDQDTCRACGEQREAVDA